MVGHGKKKKISLFLCVHGLGFVCLWFFCGCGSGAGDCSTCWNVGTNHVRKDPGVMRQHISHV